MHILFGCAACSSLDPGPCALTCDLLLISFFFFKQGVGADLDFGARQKHVAEMVRVFSHPSLACEITACTYILIVRLRSRLWSVK